MMNLYDSNLCFGSLQPISDICNDFSLGSEIPEYITSINFPLSSDAAFKMEADIDISKINKMIGIDLANGDSIGTAHLVFECPYREQVKRHKKKRINKKWAKRYGFVTKFREYQLDGLTLENRDGCAFNITATKYVY